MTMLLAALLVQAAPVPADPVLTDPIPAALPRQNLPAQGCAAYLWSRGPFPSLVAVAGAQPASLRLALDGKVVDLPQTARGDDAGLGLSATGEYRAGDLSATLALTIALRPDLSEGAIVTDAMLTIMRPGADAVLVPVGGMVGCAGAAGSPPRR